MAAAPAAVTTSRWMFIFDNRESLAVAIWPGKVTYSPHSKRKTRTIEYQPALLVIPEGSATARYFQLGETIYQVTTNRDFDFEMYQLSVSGEKDETDEEEAELTADEEAAVAARRAAVIKASKEAEFDAEFALDHAMPIDPVHGFRVYNSDHTKCVIFEPIKPIKPSV